MHHQTMHEETVMRDLYYIPLLGVLLFILVAILLSEARAATPGTQAGPGVPYAIASSTAGTGNSFPN